MSGVLEDASVQSPAIGALDGVRQRPMSTGCDVSELANSDLEQHLAGVFHLLEERIGDAAQSRESFFRMLERTVKLYQYSGMNPLRILLQRPNATYVASVSDWRKRGYEPIPGQGIIISVPREFERWKLSGCDVTGEVKAELNKCDGRSAKDALRQKYLDEGYEREMNVSFRFEFVYDIADVVRQGVDLGDPFAVNDVRNKPAPPAPPMLNANVRSLVEAKFQQMWF